MLNVKQGKRNLLAMGSDVSASYSDMRLSDEACLQAQALIAGRLGLDFSKRRQADLVTDLLPAIRRVMQPGRPLKRAVDTG